MVAQNDHDASKIFDPDPNVPQTRERKNLRDIWEIIESIAAAGIVPGRGGSRVASAIRRGRFLTSIKEFFTSIRKAMGKERVPVTSRPIAGRPAGGWGRPTGKKPEHMDEMLDFLDTLHELSPEEVEKSLNSFMDTRFGEEEDDGETYFSFEDLIKEIPEMAEFLEGFGEDWEFGDGEESEVDESEARDPLHEDLFSKGMGPQQTAEEQMGEIDSPPPSEEGVDLASIPGTKEWILAEALKAQAEANAADAAADDTHWWEDTRYDGAQYEDGGDGGEQVGDPVSAPETEKPDPDPRDGAWWEVSDDEYGEEEEEEDPVTVPEEEPPPAGEMGSDTVTQPWWEQGDSDFNDDQDTDFPGEPPSQDPPQDPPQVPSMQDTVDPPTAEQGLPGSSSQSSSGGLGQSAFINLGLQGLLQPSGSSPFSRDGATQSGAFPINLGFGTADSQNNRHTEQQAMPGIKSMYNNLGPDGHGRKQIPQNIHSIQDTDILGGEGSGDPFQPSLTGHMSARRKRMKLIRKRRLV